MPGLFTYWLTYARIKERREVHAYLASKGTRDR